MLTNTQLPDINISMNDVTKKMILSPQYKLAIKEAKESSHQHKIGAVIFKGKRIVSSAKNEVRSNHVPYRFRNFLESLHAECSAIIKAKRNLNGYSILILRIRRDGEIGLAKPCSMCYEFLQYVGIKTIYYSDNNGNIIKEDVK